MTAISDDSHINRVLDRLATLNLLTVRVVAVEYSGTTGYEAAYKLNQRLQNHKWVKNKKAIFQKRLRSGDMA